MTLSNPYNKPIMSVSGCQWELTAETRAKAGSEFKECCPKQSYTLLSQITSVDIKGRNSAWIVLLATAGQLSVML